MLKIIKKRLHFDVNPTNGKHVQNCEETFNLDVGKSITSNGNSPKKGTSPPPTSQIIYLHRDSHPVCFPPAHSSII